MHFETQYLSHPTQMGFQNLPDIHTGRYADRIQNDIYRCTIRQEGHIFIGGDDGDHTFVAMASGDFIAD